MAWFGLFSRAVGPPGRGSHGPLAAATVVCVVALVGLTLLTVLRGAHPAAPHLRRGSSPLIPGESSGLGGGRPGRTWQPTLRLDSDVPADGAIPVVASSGAPPVRIPNYARVDLRAAVSGAPAVAGAVAKHGVPPSKYWHWERGDYLDREWWRWGNASVQALQRGHPSTPGVPPPGCAVYINHLYRYIFVRNLFSAGTFFEDILGGECHNQLGDKPTCGYVLANEAANMDEERAKRLWQEYTVFTLVSNPWKRAAAVYQFLKANPAKRTGSATCVQHPWETFARDPNVFGRACQYHGCCRLPDNPAFEHQLVMSDSRCATNLGHQSAVDYVVREDALAEDLPPLLAELNKNADAGAEEILLHEVPDDRPRTHTAEQAPRDPHQPKPKLSWHWNLAWADMYTHSDPAVFTHVAMFYAEDIKFFKYPMPPVRGEGGAAAEAEAETEAHLHPLPDQEEPFCAGSEGKRWRTSTHSALPL